jgi:predicted PurR-regulated permease PerM
MTSKDGVRLIKSYIKGQILLCLILAMLYSLGFGLVGLKWGYVIGFFTGFFSWVPFFGSMIGFFAAIIVVALDFNWPLFFAVLSIYLGVQLLESAFLAPKILGRVVGLNFWQSLLAILIGTVMFGPLGTVFAVPVAAVIKLLIEKRQAKRL